MVRKIIFILLLVALTKSSYSQSNLYSDSIKVLDSSILIATSNQYKQFEFCIVNTKEIIKGLKKISYGKEKECSYEKNPIVIKLVRKGILIKTWNVRLISKVIEVEDKKYSLDTNLLSDLNKKFPIDYFIEEKVFNSQEQQDEYYLKLLKDKKFLYIIPRDFENQYREKFKLTFKRNSKFSSPRSITKYLDSVILEFVPQEKYSISYSPFDDAKNDSADEFTMTIHSVYDIYEKFNDPNSRKSGLTFFPTYIVRRK